MDKLINQKRSIHRNTGFKIKHGFWETDTGCLFCLSDLNPQVSFKTVLSKTDRIKLAWFFLISIFRTEDTQ